MYRSFILPGLIRLRLPEKLSPLAKSPQSGGRRPCQLTSQTFTQVLKDAGVQISMDGRGRWTDNVFIERLWRSVNYECVYLHALETGQHFHAWLSRYIRHYNFSRPHSSLAGRTPGEVYHQLTPLPFAGLDPDTAAGTRLAA